jgi:hypothetical protein
MQAKTPDSSGVFYFVIAIRRSTIGGILAPARWGPRVTVQRFPPPAEILSESSETSLAPRFFGPDLRRVHGL